MTAGVTLMFLNCFPLTGKYKLFMLPANVTAHIVVVLLGWQSYLQMVSKNII